MNNKKLHISNQLILKYLKSFKIINQVQITISISYKFSKNVKNLHGKNCTQKQQQSLNLISIISLKSSQKKKRCKQIKMKNQKLIIRILIKKIVMTQCRKKMINKITMNKIRKMMVKMNKEKKKIMMLKWMIRKIMNKSKWKIMGKKITRGYLSIVNRMIKKQEKLMINKHNNEINQKSKNIIYLF